MQPAKAIFLGGLLLPSPFCSGAVAAPLDRPDVLPETRPVEWAESDLSARLMDGAHQFVERKVAETRKRTAYDVVLDVYPALFAWGVLVLPKDLKPGERRPVVVCQHGRNGVPRVMLDGNETASNNFAGALAERGFIIFAPHNLYRGEDRYRWLDRKANTVKATLFSFIIAQHDQILRWLEAQPFVDDNRIAFYGLSYGGESAMRVPTILDKYCLSICSGDFNQWTRIEYFQGGHSINGEGTFDFLHEHLKWPKPGESKP